MSFLETMSFGAACGFLGWCLGYDGFMSKIYWCRCYFQGSPPPEYKNWEQFLTSKVKTGVFVRAATAEDFKGVGK